MVRQNRDTQNIYLAMHYGFAANEHVGLAKCLWQNFSYSIHLLKTLALNTYSGQKRVG